MSLAYDIAKCGKDLIFYDRDLRAGPFNNAEQTQVYSNPIPARGIVKTEGGKELFNGVNLLGVRTHTIVLEYDAQLDDSQKVIELNGRYLDILTTENEAEGDHCLILQCGVKGDKDNEANQ